MSKKKTTKKKVQKEVSNNELSKKIDILLKNSEKTNERIEVINVDLSGKIQDVSEQVEVTAMAVANVQNRLAEINTKMLGMSQKVNGLNNRFDDLASNCAKTDEVHKRFLRIEKELGLAGK